MSALCLATEAGSHGVAERGGEVEQAVQQVRPLPIPLSLPAKLNNKKFE